MTTFDQASAMTTARGAARGKVALVTGISGQDGSYLAELLLEKGYVVHGLLRRTSAFHPEHREALARARREAPPRLYLHHGDMTDGDGLHRIIEQVRPDEIYNLAAQSEVAYSFEEPEYTADSCALGPLRMLEAVRKLGLRDKTRFYQASTSEMFGLAPETPQHETTPCHPRSPYAVAKLYAHWITINYREAYGMYACNGILFNHESPLRREHYVTRKITRAMARIALGLQDCVRLGNLSARRDWGHARDYVEMQWLMLQQEQPEDFVIATGIQYSVRDFVAAAAAELGMTLEWQGRGVDETGVVCDAGRYGGARPGQVVVRVDPRLFRPAEVEAVLGDPRKAHAKLGWTPATDFRQLVADMVRADLDACLEAAAARPPSELARACTF
ncbi:MAG TPA: GDP-mannose 4,6-dehydratase [Paucimonas sp.]|nr:GDP-mannose 4,6-dehydratase [Paucimonas sp.]